MVREMAKEKHRALCLVVRPAPERGGEDAEAHAGGLQERTQPKQNLASEAMTPAFDAWLWIWMHGFFWPGVLCCNVVPSV